MSDLSLNLQKGLVGHWTMDSRDVDNGMVRDQSAYDNHGTINGDPGVSSGVVGRAFDFDGSQWIEDGLERGFNRLSFSAWIKISSSQSDSTYNSIIARSGSGYSWVTNAFQFMVNPNDELFINFNGGGNYDDNGTVVADDEWHHAALTWDGSNGQFYVDGNPTSSFSESYNIGSLSGGLLLVGRRRSDQVFKGQISDSRIYNRTLPESEVNQLYNQKVRRSANVGGGGNQQILESFDSGSFDSEWTTPNAYIQNTAWSNPHSMGSWGNGSIDATWEPSALQGGEQVDSFSYWWQEDSSQTGHQVELYDSNGNKVQHSETENPQWDLTTSDGSINRPHGGDGYNRWTYFQFDFNWEDGTYDYYLRDSQSGTVREGNYGLINSTNVEYVYFNGTNGNHCRFDELKFQL